MREVLPKLEFSDAILIFTLLTGGSLANIFCQIFFFSFMLESIFFFFFALHGIIILNL